MKDNEISYQNMKCRSLALFDEKGGNFKQFPFQDTILLGCAQMNQKKACTRLSKPVQAFVSLC